MNKVVQFYALYKVQLKNTQEYEALGIYLQTKIKIVICYNYFICRFFGKFKLHTFHGRYFRFLDTWILFYFD